MAATSATSGVYVDLAQLLALRHLANLVDITSSIKKQAELAGIHMSRARGRGMDFDEVRIYQPGDDVRTIDWRVTARTQKPHTKLYKEERERPVMILADQSASLFFGSQQSFKSVLAARLATLIAWSTLVHGDRVGGIVFSNQAYKEIRPRRHKQAVLGLANALINANHALNKNITTQSTNYLFTVLGKARHALKSGGRLIIISDFSHYDEACYRELYKVAQHNQVICFFVYDPLEKQLPSSGLYSISNHKKHLRFDTHNQQLQTAYTNQFTQHLNYIKNDFLRCGIQLLEAGTHQDLLQILGPQLAPKMSQRYASYA